MKFTKCTVLVVLALIIALSATGCISYQSKATYFGGSVLVEYYQIKGSQESDNLTFTFYDTGKYHVSFSTTPGTYNFIYAKYMPTDRDIVIDKTPRVYLIEQYILPDYVRITITKDGDVPETHDFQ